MSAGSSRETAVPETPRPRLPNEKFYQQLPELQLIYDTAPVGLAFLSPDCHYVQINRRLTEIPSPTTSGDRFAKLFHKLQIRSKKLLKLSYARESRSRASKFAGSDLTNSTPTTSGIRAGTR